MTRAAALAAVLALCLPALGRADQASTSAGAPRVIKLISLTLSASSQTGPDSRTVWEIDRLYNAARQFGRRKGALVGTDRAVVVRYRSGREWVSVSARLPGGSIDARGNVRRAHGLSISPVTGGTGRFAHARGTLTVLDFGTRSRYAANVYRLRP